MKNFNTKFVIAKLNGVPLEQSYIRFQYKICYSKMKYFNIIRYIKLISIQNLLQQNNTSSFGVGGEVRFQYKICYSKIYRVIDFVKGGCISIQNLLQQNEEMAEYYRAPIGFQYKICYSKIILHKNENAPKSDFNTKFVIAKYL